MNFIVLPRGSLLMTLVFLVCLIPQIFYGQTVINAFPYEEGFENAGAMPDSWQQSFISGDDVSWSFQNGDDYNASAWEGSYNALLSDDDDGEDKTRLITPVFDLSSYQQAELTFYHIQDDDYNVYQDELRVYYQTSGEGAWELLKTYTDPVSEWTQRTVHLPEVSSTVRIAFEGNAKKGHGVGIDQVKVDAGNFNVSFFVMDSLDQHPILDAQVWLGDSSQLTNTGGEAIFEDFPAGEDYVVRIEKGGYAVFHDTINVFHNDSVYVKLLNADSAEYQIDFHLTHIDTGEPIEDAEVNLSGAGNKNTNPEGAVTFYGISPGVIDYTITHDLFQNYRDSVSISNDHVAENVNMRPKELFLVEFTVQRGSDQTAIDGAEVHLADSVKYTDEQGKSSFLFPDGTYAYEVVFEGFEQATGSVNVNGEDVFKNIDLYVLANHLPAMNIRVFPNPVKDVLMVENEEQFAGETLQIIDMNGQLKFSKKLTGTMIVIPMSHFPAGMYIVQIIKQGNRQQIKIIKSHSSL